MEIREVDFMSPRRPYALCRSMALAMAMEMSSIHEEKERGILQRRRIRDLA